MLGTRDEFLYWECSDCGCLSLVEVPPDLGSYYPQNYYSLQIRPSTVSRRVRDAIYLSPLSFLVNWRSRSDLDAIRGARLTKKLSLLDVGCGAGTLIGDLRELGYDARGIDPYVVADVKDRFGVRVERKSLEEVHSQHDVILFRHSLEHMPIETLQLARSRVKKNGICVVCIPVLGWAWRNYGTDWVQLDAPRHLFLHSRKSFTMLAAKSGFHVQRIVFDSTEFQFWGSELYQRNIPLKNMPEPTSTERARMRRLARDLNRQEQGDTAQFYLKPV